MGNCFELSFFFSIEIDYYSLTNFEYPIILHKGQTMGGWGLGRKLCSDVTRLLFCFLSCMPSSKSGNCFSKMANPCFGVLSSNTVPSLLQLSLFSLRF